MTMHKVVGLLAGAAAMLAASFAANPANANATKVILAHPFAVNSLEDQAHKKLAELLNERGGGRFEARVFPAGQLGGFQQVIQGMPTGLAHGIFISSGTLGLINPVASVTVWPYLFTSRDEFNCAYDSPTGEALSQMIEETTGYKVVAPTYKGVRNLYSKRPVHTPADLTGLKVRVAPITVYTEPWRALGALPTTMDWSEAYGALRQGVVDAAEIELMTAYGAGFADVIKHVTLTRHAMDNYAWLFHANWVEQLPADLREILVTSATDSAAWFTEQVVEGEKEVLDKFKAAGVEVIEVDVAPFRERVQPAMEKALPDMVEWATRLREAGQSCS